jgi:short-subunit dehydrogenase
MPVQADLADQQSSEAIYRRVAAAGVTVDILVNNAGFNVYGSFLQTDLLEETRMIAVNFTSLVALSKLFGRDMAQRSRGKILNVGSTASFAPAPFASVYAATKAAVLSVSEALSEEFRGTGVTVTVLCPGPIDTDFARRAKMTNTKIFSGKLGSAEAVVRLGLDALQQGKGLAFTSFADRLQIFSMRFSPRQLIAKVGKSLLSPSS